MLGNIQFIGHLFRQRMLTENIMHQCVKKLLENDSSPKVEDLECLSKLLTTIGGQLESPEFNPRKVDERTHRGVLQKARQTMDVYMGRVSRMSEMEALDSRIRFMLKVGAGPAWAAWACAGPAWACWSLTGPAWPCWPVLCFCWRAALSAISRVAAGGRGRLLWPRMVASLLLHTCATQCAATWPYCHGASHP
jgi:hypothetical protein